MIDLLKKEFHNALKCAFEDPLYDGFGNADLFYLVKVDYLANCNEFCITITNRQKNFICDEFKHNGYNFTITLQTSTARLKNISKIMREAKSIIKSTLDKVKAQKL